MPFVEAHVVDETRLELTPLIEVPRGTKVFVFVSTLKSEQERKDWEQLALQCLQAAFHHSLFVPMDRMFGIFL